MNFFLSKSFYKLPPILPVLIAYILQIVLFVSWGDWSRFTAAILFNITLIGAALINYKKQWPILLSCLIMAMAGLWRLHSISLYYDSFPFTPPCNKSSIMGEIYSFTHNPQSRFPFSYTVHTSSICSESQEISGRYYVQLFTRKKLDAQIADTVFIPNIIFKKAAKNNSFQNYLIKEGIAATSFLENCLCYSIAKPEVSLRRWCHETRENIFLSYQRRLSKDAFGIFSAVFMGEKGALKKDKERLEAPFRQWGIVHYLARSGLHLVIIVSLSELWFGLLPLAFPLKQLLMITFAALYYLFTWPSISFIRALLIFLIYKSFLLFRKSDHFLHMLFLCCLLLLLYNPLYLLFLDFQLSFGLTFALAWLNLFKTVYTEQKVANY